MAAHICNRRYTVDAEAGVAEEMFRYDNAKVISREFKKCDPKWNRPDLVEAYTIWTYVFEMFGVPTHGRWASFGYFHGCVQEVVDA